MTPDAINVVALFAFAIGLLLGSGSTAFRMLQLHRGHEPLPELIWRDLQVIGLLSLAFLLVAADRAFGWQLRTDAWWALLVAGCAVAAVWVYVWYELVIIGHRRDRR